MRLFVAVPLPNQIRRSLSKVKSSFADFPAKWVREENLHITLVFIGDINPSPSVQSHTLEYKTEHGSSKLGEIAECAPRDEFICWDAPTRREKLHLVTNNMRFLILPWVRAPHLASHILERVTRRINSDWMGRYGHPIYLLETFVERDCFQGICYQAANWIKVGQTRGRSRNGHPGLKVPIKDIYLYPLTKRFRDSLSQRADEQEGREVEGS